MYADRCAHDDFNLIRMLSDEDIEKLNQGYVCPLDAGPAWRAACEYGFDMSLVEEALSKPMEQRLADHDRFLAMLVALRNDQAPK